MLSETCIALKPVAISLHNASCKWHRSCLIHSPIGLVKINQVSTNYTKSYID